MSDAARVVSVVCVAVCALMVASPARATTIGVNLRIGSNDSNSVDADETAGAVPVSGQYWNNITIAQTQGLPTSFYDTSFQLQDDAGNANAATLTSTLVSGDGYADWSDVTSSANRGKTGDAGLMQSLVSNAAGPDGGRHIEVSGLGGSFLTNGYSVYLFFEGSNTRTYELTVTPTTGTPMSVFGKDNGDNSDGDNNGHIDWRQATGTSMATANSANYARFAGLTASGFAIDLDADSSRGSLNGIQIVETPQFTENAISISFMRSSDLDYTQLFSDEAVGVVPRPNWNDIDVYNNHAFAPIALLDAHGNPTSATVASSISPGYDANNGNGNDSSDHTMMNASLYFDNGVGTDTGNITIADLPDFLTVLGYDVYVYFECNSNNRDMTITIDGVSITGRDAADFKASDLFLLAQGAGIEANYMVFEDLMASSFSIDATATNGRAAIAGIQIVANADVIPEPATLSLLGLGALALLRRRRC